MSHDRHHVARDLVSDMSAVTGALSCVSHHVVSRAGLVAQTVGQRRVIDVC